MFGTGESVDDCGGGYSESIAEMCDELQNGSVPLMIQTPNGRDESGSNRDCFLLNPTLKTALHQNMFRFLGQLSTLALIVSHICYMNISGIVVYTLQIYFGIWFIGSYVVTICAHVCIPRVGHVEGFLLIFGVYIIVYGTLLLKFSQTNLLGGGGG